MRMAIWLTCLFSLLVWLTACNTALSYAGRPIPFTPGLIFEKIDRDEVFSDPAAKALGDAACRGQTKAIEASIASGVDPDVRGLKGLTPMAMALKCESFTGVKTLLENGADPNAVFFDGWVVPLSVAPEYDDRRIMEALLAAGAHVHIAGGITAPFEGALHYKRRTGSWERLDLLVQHGLDIDTYRSKSPPGRYSPTYLSNLLSSGEPCKALEYIKHGPRVNEHRLLLAANSRYYSNSEDRCKAEINTILRSRLDPEEVERFPEEFSEAAQARVRALDEN